MLNSSFMMHRLIVVCLSLTLFTAAQPTGAILVSEGQARSLIVLVPDASDLEKATAQQLQTYIGQIAGAQPAIATDAAGFQGVKIFIGKACPNPELSKIVSGGDDPASFRLHVTANAIQLAGLSDQGTQYAAYELLEQLGVRWFVPSNIGTVIPVSKTLAVRVQDTIQHPAFSTRLLQAIGGGSWSDFMRLGGPDYGGHGFPCNISNRTRPDLFLQDAQRKATNHLDVSKPEVLDCAVAGALDTLKKNPGRKYVNMGPDDGVPTVLQPNPEWDGTDYDATIGALSTTDRYVRFFNLVVEKLKANGYPDVGIAFYAYSSYERPPVRWTPDPKIMPIFAPITIDRLHAMNNPLSWERAYLKDLIEGWTAKGVHPGYRGYLFNLADPGLPFSMVQQVSSEFKFFKDHNIDFIRVETLPAWAYHGPSLYLAAKMMWNPNLDVEATLDDYFSKFYGPAAKPMRKHFNILENAFAEADYFTGNVYDFPHILTPQVMKNMKDTLEQAEGLARRDSVYADRVNMVRIAFDFGDRFLSMMDAVKQFDFIKAKRQLDQVYELSVKGLAHTPPVFGSVAQGYIPRFWGAQVQQGYDRVTNGNKMIVQLPDEWNVMLFPNGSGDQLGLWKPGLGTQSWLKLKTYSATWSDQGLRYYKGDAWYKTTITVPKRYDEGHPIHLWFSNIDEAARVWINGQELPVLAKGSALGSPWEFDATGTIKFDRPNDIAVDVTNKNLDELGTGGIGGPVMLYETAK